jgi:uncharacterized protein YdeI (YjbR/CyaY-like superfamily)
MGKRDPRIDAYISKSADFARPILTYIREVVHEGCPEVEETIKWGSPHFDYKGIMCGMAAFKQHCAFGFWKGSLIVGTSKTAEAMGQFGRIEKVSDLPPRKTLLSCVRKAKKLNDQGIKSPITAKRKSRPEIPVPDYFRTALGKNRKAQAAFDALSPSHRREYLEWITEARTEATRERRMSTALDWITEGKSRNWKYER